MQVFAEESGLFEMADRLGEDERQVGLLRGMVLGYSEKWLEATSSVVLVETETVLSAPLYNLDTNGKSRSFVLAGKIDKVVEIDGSLVIVDHKTTSLDITDPNSNYWRRLRIDNQLAFYWNMALANGWDVKSVQVDAVQKSQARPRKIHSADLLELEAIGKYFKFNASKEAISHAMTEGKENAELFGWRIAREDSTRYQRYTVPRTNQELVEFHHRVWDISKDMLEVRKTGRAHQVPSACLLYGTACEYLGVCSHHDELTSDNWMTVDNVHPELGEEVPDGDVITNSRMSCFLECRRKHQHRYESGKRRVHEEQKESLQFGTAWHHMMDLWWSLACQKGNDDEYDEESTATEVVRSEAESPQGDINSN